MNYYDSQRIIFDYICDSIKKNKLSHAYLINSNDNKNALEIIQNIAYLIYEGKDIYDDSIFYNNLNIKLIDTKKNIISKEDIIELEKEFTKKEINKNKMIYIINNCDKMNLHASNTILKFLEEPPEGVIALFLTNNISNVLDTIKSRCQILKLRKDKLYVSNEIELFESIFPLLSGKITRESIDTIMTNIYSFLNYLTTNNKNNTLLFGKKYLDNILTDKNVELNMKERNEIILKIILYYFYDILKVKYGLNEEIFFKNKKDDIIMNSKKISEIALEKMILNVLKNIDKNKYNLNNSMFIDNVILELG